MKSTQTAINSNDMIGPWTRSHAPTITHKNLGPETITHEDEKIALVLFLTGGFVIWNIFQ